MDVDHEHSHSFLVTLEAIDSGSLVLSSALRIVYPQIMKHFMFLFTCWGIRLGPLELDFQC
jgi:hypothetical protein